MQIMGYLISSEFQCMSCNKFYCDVIIMLVFVLTLQTEIVDA